MDVFHRKFNNLLGCSSDSKSVAGGYSTGLVIYQALLTTTWKLIISV